MIIGFGPIFSGSVKLYAAIFALSKLCGVLAVNSRFRAAFRRRWAKSIDIIAKIVSKIVYYMRVNSDFNPWEKE